MTKKLNCWEITACGREPGGTRVAELGVCPAATDASCDGINNGQNAGRLCWAIAGSLCGGVIRGTFAAKYRHCSTCVVYQQVRAEEGRWGFVLLKSEQMHELRDYLLRKWWGTHNVQAGVNGDHGDSVVCKTAG